ncbi:hypothetical protein ES332_A01G040600v1 [Gossypium tomentosum]|uniref:Uncharacterized protein n=1 Tax=Gossypium tomentosum TaxID=34277 RepID=A0A5D2RLB9_GOSTO|nr:hypothetical protein ES332_A01G040600v1 [Gossypium tomentosum]
MSGDTGPNPISQFSSYNQNFHFTVIPILPGLSVSIQKQNHGGKRKEKAFKEETNPQSSTRSSRADAWQILYENGFFLIIIWCYPT